MSLAEVVVEGTLQPDGSLDLDSKPELTAGRVRVSLQKLSTEMPAEDWWQYMQRTRRELEQSNHPMMSDEEAQTCIDSMRADDDRIEAVHRQFDGARQSRDESEC